MSIVTSTVNGKWIKRNFNDRVTERSTIWKEWQNKLELYLFKELIRLPNLKVRAKQEF